MFFFNLLVAVFKGQLLAPFHSFHGFLCEFGNVHTQSLLYRSDIKQILFYLFYQNYNKTSSCCQYPKSQKARKKRNLHIVQPLFSL